MRLVILLAYFAWAVCQSNSAAFASQNDANILVAQANSSERYEYRDKLHALLSQLEALNGRGNYTESDVRKLSELTAEFQHLKENPPPGNEAIDRELTSKSQLNSKFFLGTDGDGRGSIPSIIRSIQRSMKMNGVTSEKQIEANRLRRIYSLYMIISTCAERFPIVAQFSIAKDRLKEIAKANERNQSQKEIEGIWNSAAERFSKYGTDTTANEHLYPACIQQLELISFLIQGQKGDGPPPNAPKKDF